jgi:ABC-type oligopeptide transport system ATPase subunit
MTLLELRDVHVVYSGRRRQDPVIAVAGVNLALESGQVIGLAGESGCGKSSLARVAVGLLAPTSGTVAFEGTPVEPVGAAGRAARRDFRWCSRTRTARSTRAAGWAARSRMLS